MFKFRLAKVGKTKAKLKRVEITYDIYTGVQTYEAQPDYIMFPIYYNASTYRILVAAYFFPLIALIYNTEETNGLSAFAG